MKFIDLRTAKYLFVKALITNGFATPDAGRPEPGQKFRNQDGKAYGSFVRDLADHGRIIEVDRITSNAPSRHHGLTRLWQAVDYAYLRLLGEALKPTAEAELPGLFGLGG